MAQILNQYSFVILVGFFLFILAWVVLRRGHDRRRWWILAGVVLAAGLAWFFLRATQTSSVDLAQVESAIGGGQPVLLEFQSPF